MNCYFCNSKSSTGFCLKCPNRVGHFYEFCDGQKYLDCVEIIYKEYIVAIYLKPDINEDERSGKCYIFHPKFDTMILERNPGITPTNIKEKLQMILTFQ
jgi:hypothetical protein